MDSDFDRFDANAINQAEDQPDQRRRVSNPPNPWLSEHSEYLEEVPVAELEIYEETAKSILSQNSSPDIPFRYSINPYRGCFHGCAYCYARPSHELLGLGAGSDFDFKITAKINAPELLRKAFEKRSWNGDHICFSGVTDPYQPIEANYQLTRKCLEVCAEYRNPVSIITKGVIIERDIDLLTEIAKHSSVHVICSLPFYDPETARKVEVAVPTPQRRLLAVERLSAAGIPVGVFIAPLIPGLNDSEAADILAHAKHVGAVWASFLLLRLPGSTEHVFRQRIREQFPTRADKILSQLDQCRGGELAGRGVGRRMSGEGNLYQAISSLLKLLIKRQGFPGWPARPEKSAFRRPEKTQTQSAPVKPKGNPNQLTLFDLFGTTDDA